MKMHSLLAKFLLLVLLYGSYHALSDARSAARPTAAEVLLADAPGMVYAQPAALLSPARQQLVLAEQQLPLPVFESVPGVIDRVAAYEKANGNYIGRLLRRDQWRVASFGSTDIISPFHHFF